MTAALGRLACAGLVLVTAASAACSGSDGDDPGVEVEDDAEAPVPEDDAGAPPPTTDADAGDAPPPPPADGGFCARHASSPTVRFCDDFDDGDLENGWTVVNASPPTEVSIDLAEDAKSLPFAFVAETDPVVADVTHNASLRRSVPGTYTRASLSLAMKLPSVDVGEGDVTIATLDVANDHFFTLHLRDANLPTPGPSLEESHPTLGGVRRTPLTGAPAAGVWTELSVELDLAAGSAKVRFGADVVLDGGPIVAAPGNGSVVRVGAVYVVGPTPTFRILVDDVLLETQ